VIVKEVGFGMSRESIWRLRSAGVKVIDVGGAGGTDFMAIEESRSGSPTGWNWGIPTAVSLLEALSLNSPGQLVASGGIEHALDCVKALALGATLVGMARHLLRVLMDHSEQGLITHLENIIYDLRRIMLMLGARKTSDLTLVPLVISGTTYHWVSCRGIEVEHYARRKGLG